MRSDHYAVLGVSRRASSQEVRAAYLRVMRSSHPDRARGDPAAAERARQANAAYEVLGDVASRAAYDRLLGSALPEDPDGVTVRRAGRAPHATVYSPDRADYAAAFRRASLRVALTVLGIGTVLLVLAGA
jgi:DnaJ-class molecular chaperone